MANEKGWISLHRKIQDHWIYERKSAYSNFEAWIDLLLNANHKQGKWPIGNTLCTIEPGEQVRSMRTLANKWNWSIGKVRRFLDLLQSDNMIVFKNETQTTRITICNWEAYQNTRNENGTRTERKRNTNGTRTETNNNVNNDNNVNKSGAKRKRFTPPTVSEILKYANEREANIDAERFVDYYTSIGWTVGNKKMKDWKAAVRNWIRKDKESKFDKPKTDNYNTFDGGTF